MIFIPLKKFQEDISNYIKWTAWSSTYKKSSCNKVPNFMIGFNFSSNRTQMMSNFVDMFYKITRIYSINFMNLCKLFHNLPLKGAQALEKNGILAFHHIKPFLTCYMQGKPLRLWYHYQHNNSMRTWTSILRQDTYFSYLKWWISTSFK